MRKINKVDIAVAEYRADTVKFRDYVICAAIAAIVTFAVYTYVVYAGSRVVGQTIARVILV